MDENWHETFWNRVIVITLMVCVAVGVFVAVNDGEKAQQRHDMQVRQQVTTSEFR